MRTALDVPGPGVDVVTLARKWGARVRRMGRAPCPRRGRAVVDDRSAWLPPPACNRRAGKSLQRCDLGVPVRLCMAVAWTSAVSKFLPPS